jgi:DNA-binding MarR family transcriptional regulator
MYTHMPQNEYRWLVSTYKPSELGRVEFRILDLFATSPPCSAYQIYSIFKEEARQWTGSRSESMMKPLSYKNIHKRVKRLTQLKLIERVEGQFERGAKYYKISPHGLINYVGGIITESDKFIFYNMQNIVIQSLLLEFFEEETIDSFRTLKDFVPSEIGDYLHDCCSITTTLCKEFWNKYQEYNLQDILPEEKIIQKYMSYIEGKPIDEGTLKEIENYRNRLQVKLNEDNENNSKEHRTLVAGVKEYKNTYFHEKKNLPYYYQDSPINYAFEKPPFPLLDIYYKIVWRLEIELEIKIKLLTFNLISQLGEMITEKHIENKEQLEEDLLDRGRDDSLRHTLKDKKFIDLVRNIKKDFDIGYKQFLYYH